MITKLNILAPNHLIYKFYVCANTFYSYCNTLFNPRKWLPLHDSVLAQFMTALRRSQSRLEVLG